VEERVELTALLSALAMLLLLGGGALGLRWFQRRARTPQLRSTVYARLSAAYSMTILDHRFSLP
jgi:hypothetical protein